MNLKLSDILNLHEIYDKINSQSLPIKTVYKFSKLFNAVNIEVTFYEEEIRKIILAYGEKDSDGNPKKMDNGEGYQLKAECTKIAQQKVQELLDLEVDLPDIRFTLTELESVTFTIEEFNKLLPFMEDE